MSVAAMPHPGAESLARPAMLWATAAAVALAAHAGAAAWALRQTPEPIAEAAAPPAMMIELAPEVMAPPEEIDQVSPDMVDQMEMTSQGVAEPTPIEPPPPIETPPVLDEPPPVETPPEVEPPVLQPPVVETPPVPAEVVQPPVPRPPVAQRQEPRPEPPQEKPREERPAPAPQREQVQNRTVAPTAAERSASPSTAPSAGSRGQVSPARWQSRLMAHLERRKRYPSAARRRGEEGVAYVRFSIDDGGNVRSVALARSSGFPELDAEVVAMVRRASPVPAPPPDAPRDITAPVQFHIR